MWPLPVWAVCPADIALEKTCNMESISATWRSRSMFFCCMSLYSSELAAAKPGTARRKAGTLETNRPVSKAVSSTPPPMRPTTVMGLRMTVRA